jgi:dihydroorotase
MDREATRLLSAFFAGPQVGDGAFMATLAIVNAMAVNEGFSSYQDIRVQDGRIEAIGSHLSTDKVDRVIDARGRALLPGMIDDQVHFGNRV